MFWFLPFAFCSNFEIFDAIERPKFFFKLNNDVPVLFIKSDSKYSRFSFSINTGSVDDFKDCKGISHLLEHCIFGVNTELLKFIYDHGGSIIACTDESSITFEYVILNEYFIESLEILFRALNDPVFTPKSVNDEIILVDQEFSYRSLNNSEASNMCGEINELNVFTTGNLNTLLIKNIVARLEEIYKKNFFRYNGSILCITDASRKFIQEYNLNYEKKPQHRAKKTLLTDYFNIDERLFLIKSASNILFIKIKIPLEESPFLLCFFIEGCLEKIAKMQNITTYNFSIDFVNMYHVVNIYFYIKRDQSIHPRLFINKFINIIKNHKLLVNNYGKSLNETYNSVAKDIKPLEFLNYSNMHKYIQFLPYLFEKGHDKKQFLKFNKPQFLSLAKHLIDPGNYSALYECDFFGDPTFSKYNSIPYKNIHKGCSRYCFVSYDSKDADSTELSIESNLYSVVFRKPKKLFNTNKMFDTKFRSGLDSDFNPEDLIDINYNEYLKPSSIQIDRHIDDDYYDIITNPTYKIHYIHIKDTQDKILTIQFFINDSYQNFLKLIYLMGCLEFALNDHFKLHRNNRVTFRIKHNMLEILFKRSNDINHRLIVTKYIANCIENLPKYLPVINTNAQSLITTQMKEIAENVYGERTLIDDFIRFTSSSPESKKLIPEFYLNIGFFGRTNLLLRNELIDLVDKIKPNLEYNNFKKDTDGFTSSISIINKYSRFSLYLQDRLDLSTREIVVRLCVYFALYRLVETLRIDDKIGYHVFTDFTSETVYTNFSIEGYSTKEDSDIKNILSDYVITVVKSVKNMSTKEFKTFLNVVYNTYKLRSNNIKEIFHFCRSLNFQINYKNFNDELEKVLNSKNIRNEIIDVLSNEVFSLMD